MDHGGGARWERDALTFRLPDPDRHLAGVRLLQDVGIPAERLLLRYDDGDRAWRLDVPQPNVWRLEYRLELHQPDGGSEIVCDAANPRRVGGAYGDRSVVHRPDYVEPAWLRRPGARGAWRELSIRAPALDSDVWARIWSPQVPTDRVLVAHDGPEYDKLAELGQYSAAMVAAGRLPPHHLVLLAPGDRNEWYSANPAYAVALAVDVLPRVHAEVDTVRPVVGMGASLGGLAMLHAQRRFPGAFAGLFLQSGSFFRPRLDPQESDFSRFRRITRFTGRVVHALRPPRPVPTVLTCGQVEENLANNRAMTRALRRQGYPAELFEVPDAHAFTGWRDAFDPYLTNLLRSVWMPDPTETG
jgi:enterochelin esterase-like enzyme